MPFAQEKAPLEMNHKGISGVSKMRALAAIVNLRGAPQRLAQDVENQLLFIFGHFLFTFFFSLSLSLSISFFFLSLSLSLSLYLSCSLIVSLSPLSLSFESLSPSSLSLSLATCIFDASAKGSSITFSCFITFWSLF